MRPQGSLPRRDDEAELSGRIDALLNLVRTLLIEAESLRMTRPGSAERCLDFYNEVRRFEAGLIRRALEVTAGNQRRAARLLGLHPPTLHAKLKSYGIKYPGKPDEEA